MLVFFAFAVLLSIGAINALIPIIIILILIAAAAGSTRGYSIFAILGIGTIAGMGPSGKGSMAGKGSYPFRSILDPNIRGPRKSPERKARKEAKRAIAKQTPPTKPLKPWQKKAFEIAKWAVAPAIVGSGIVVYKAGRGMARRITRSTNPQGRRDVRSARTGVANDQLSKSLGSRKAPQYKPDTTPGAPPGSGMVTNRLSTENREIVRRILDARKRGIGAVPTSAIGVGAGTELRRAALALKNRQFKVANTHLNNVSKIVSHNLQQRQLNAVSGKALRERQKLLKDMNEANEIGKGRTATRRGTTYTGADVGAARTMWGSLAMAGIARLRGDRYGSDLYKRDALAQLKVRSAEGGLALSDRLRYGVTDKKGSVTMGPLHQQIGRAARQEKAGENARAREKRLRELEMFLYGSRDVYDSGGRLFLRDGNGDAIEGRIGALDKINGLNPTTAVARRNAYRLEYMDLNAALRSGRINRDEYDRHTEILDKKMDRLDKDELGRIRDVQQKYATGEVSQLVYEKEMGRIQKEQNLLSKLAYEHSRLTSGNPPGRIEVSFKRKIGPEGEVEANGLLPTIKINPRQTGTAKPF